MTAFSRATIVIATSPPQEVQAMVRGGLAVHGSAGLYTVTHVASGKAICHSDQQRTAKGVAIELLEMGASWSSPTLSASEAERATEYLQGAGKVIDGKAFFLASKPKTQAGKSIVAPRARVEPCYPTYFTPSVGLDERDKKIAAFIEKAFNDETPTMEEFQAYAHPEVSAGMFWRELIMVRMGTGKQAKLLDKDIPDKSPPVFPLPSGIEPGYAGVKQLTQQMWKLGQAIDEQARLMTELYEIRPPVDAWMAIHFTDWMAMDDLFSEMVKRGWCDWAVCVNLFTQLSKEEQQRITDVLGFVGSEEQGYHAYGAKTFMRSKRLPELLRCRRSVKQALEG